MFDRIKKLLGFLWGEVTAVCVDILDIFKSRISRPFRDRMLLLILEQAQKDMETLNDKLWDHCCPALQGLDMKVGLGQPCNWCGATENTDEQ